jgi:predicted kinase
MRLIIINGPWGVGKSTTAALLHHELPSSFHLELDALRRSISGYELDRQKSFYFSLTLALSIIDQCFKDGRDVIIDKMFFDSTVIDQLIAVSNKYNATVHEFILWCDNRTLLERGATRGYSSGVFSIDKAQRSWELISKLIPTRPQATVLDTNSLSPTAVAANISSIIE